MKSSFSKNILRSVVALSCYAGSTLGVGANTLVNARANISPFAEKNTSSLLKKLKSEVIDNVPERFKDYYGGCRVETLGDLCSCVDLTSGFMCEEIPEKDLAYYTKALKRLFPNDIIFNGAKKKMKNFDSFIYALGKTMSDYTRAYYNDEARLKSSKEQTWKYQRGCGLADSLIGRWGYEEVDQLTSKLILMKLMEVANSI